MPLFMSHIWQGTQTVAESEISDTDDMEKAIKDSCLADDQETERFSVEVELKDDSTADI